MTNQFPINLNAAIDLALSADGDLVLGPDGDFVTVSGLDAFQQDILFRLKTARGDYQLAPQCGASLNTLIGSPLSPATGSRLQSLVITALTHDGFLDSNSIEVETFPSDSKTLSALIHIDLSNRFLPSTLPSQGSILSIQINVDLQEGLIL